DKVFTKDILAEDAIKKINGAATAEELKLISINGDERSTVKDAYKAKNKELKE
ncbi:hypothetical protein LCGC14_2416600, partial [marine sediment metagenome]